MFNSEHCAIAPFLITLDVPQATNRFSQQQIILFLLVLKLAKQLPIRCQYVHVKESLPLFQCLPNLRFQVKLELPMSYHSITELLTVLPTTLCTSLDTLISSHFEQCYIFIITTKNTPSAKARIFQGTFKKQSPLRHQAFIKRNPLQAMALCTRT